MNITAPQKNKLYRFAFSVISVIVLLSLLFSAFLISIANDIYAFVKKDASVHMNITEPTSLNNIAREMQRNGIINNPTVFSLYVRSKGKAQIFESFQGEIYLNAEMSYRDIVNEFLK